MRDNNDSLSRFATQSSHIKQRNPAGIFQPNRNLKLSVFRTQGMTDSEIQKIGRDVVAKHPVAKRLYGWATVKRKDVLDLGLSIIDDPSPSKHSDIVGWPEDEYGRTRIRLKLFESASVSRLTPPLRVKE